MYDYGFDTYCVSLAVLALKADNGAPNVDVLTAVTSERQGGEQWGLTHQSGRQTFSSSKTNPSPWSKPETQESTGRAGGRTDGRVYWIDLAQLHLVRLISF